MTSCSDLSPEGALTGSIKKIRQNEEFFKSEVCVTYILIAYAVYLRKSKTGFVDSDIPPLREADIEAAECLFCVPSAPAESPGKQGHRRICGAGGSAVRRMGEIGC